MSLHLNVSGQWRERQKKICCSAQICNLWHNHTLAVLVRNKSSGCRKHLLYWHSPARVLLAALGPIIRAPAPGSPPVLWSTHPHLELAATCIRGAFSPDSVVHSLGADMWAAVLSVHYEHSWGFVRREEKIYLSKLWRKSPQKCATVSREFFFGSSYVWTLSRTAL